MMKKILLIGHDTLNVSAALNLETNLTSCFIADQKYKIENRSQIKGSESHNYYEKYYYDQQLFPKIWRQLKAHKIVKHNLDYITNTDTYKLSPFRGLSPEQQDLKEKVIGFCKRSLEDTKHEHHVFFISGEAGTGKSVVLSSIFKTIQDLAESQTNTKFKRENNFLLVNHNEMLKTYKKIAESLPNLKKKNFMKPTSFINSYDKGEGAIQKADIVLVDEAHLLLSTKDNYNNFHFDNQFEEIIKRSKVTIIVFDEKQVLKLKSHWDFGRIKKLKSLFPAYEEYHLTTQFRMKADPKILDWIDAFVERKILPFPKGIPKPNEEKQYDQQEFEFEIFSSAEDMRQKIEAKNQAVGLSRIVATFDYVHKKDGHDYFVEEGDFSAPWNRTNYKNSWAEEAATIHEVGSIYTVQGFDLNYVGVILGPSIGYDAQKDEVTVDIKKYKDTEAFKNREDIEQIEKEKERIILNSVNVLLKRAISGLYIYASDDALREKLLSIQEERSKWMN